jgi:hypothetical protein
MKGWQPFEIWLLLLLLLVAGFLPLTELYSYHQKSIAYQNALTTILNCRQSQARLSGPRPGLDAVCSPIPRREDF